LGYRKCLVDEWVRPGGGKIPPWPGDMRLFREGMGALGVMAVYFAPVLALSWWLGAGVSQAGSWVDMLKYIFQGLILVPVTFPLNPILQSLHDPGYILTPDRFAIHLAAATLSVFLIPTGFMQLGRRGSYWDALRLDRGISTLVRHPVRYLLAWWVSLRLTLRAMARGVLAPWGIAWSYTGIVYVFQLVLAASRDAGDRDPYSNGFLNGGCSTGTPGGKMISTEYQLPMLLMVFQGLLGAWDTLYYHEFRFRLIDHAAHTRDELILHGVRDLIYAFLFLVLPQYALSGAWAWLAVILILAEICITIVDFVVERRARAPLGGLAAGELAMHAFMAVVYGAFILSLAPHLLVGISAPTALEPQSAPLPRLLVPATLLMGFGVGVAGVRDLFAAFMVRRG
jgi:hypothetical protein